jgi:hypothetical protein
VGLFSAYNGYQGGIDLDVANLDDDPEEEIVTAAGGGGSPHVRVFNVDQATGAKQDTAVSFNAYPGFTGGARVAVGDVTGDGVPEIVTGAGPGAGAHVRVFNRDGTVNNPGWNAYTPGFRGGVDVAVGNFDEDVALEIVTGAGPGGGPHIRIFNGNGSVVNEGIYAYNAEFTGGVFVAAGNLDNTGTAAIVTAPMGQGGPHIAVFNSNLSVRNGGWYAYGSAFNGGATVAVANVLGAANSGQEIITGAGPGGGPHVRIFDEAGGVLSPDPGFMAVDPATGYSGGIVVGGGNVRTQPNEVSGGEIVSGALNGADFVVTRRINR